MPTITAPNATRTTHRRRTGRRRRNTTLSRLLRGLLAAVGVTLGCVLIFALLMQWLKPSDTAVRVVNQLIKLAAIFAGVCVTVGKGGERGLTLGAGLGLCYMLAGVALYALLTGQQLPVTAYVSDVAMGVAGGGIAGAIVGRKG